MNFFFCDITGTFTGDKESRSIDIVNFVNNLKRIIEKDELDDLIVSFVSTSRIEDVIEAVEELKKYIDDERIMIGESFGENKVIVDNDIKEACVGKISQMHSVLKNTSVNNIYYADDCELCHDMFAGTIHSFLCKQAVIRKQPITYNKIVQFVLGAKTDEYEFSSTGKNIDSINKIMIKYINKKEKVKKLDELV